MKVGSSLSSRQDSSKEIVPGHPGRHRGILFHKTNLVSWKKVNKNRTELLAKSIWVEKLGLELSTVYHHVFFLISKKSQSTVKETCRIQCVHPPPPKDPLPQWSLPSRITSALKCSLFLLLLGHIIFRRLENVNNQNKKNLLTCHGNKLWKAETFRDPQVLNSGSGNASSLYFPITSDLLPHFLSPTSSSRVRHINFDH